MNNDRLQQRTQETRNSLMRAAEQLIADKGVENVTARAITMLAGQKNESALQYHFGNFQGLIEAIFLQRNRQVEARRIELLQALLAEKARPALRDVCELMIGPAFQLASEDEGFVLYVKGFGRELAVSDLPAGHRLSKRNQPATLETRHLLFDALADIDQDIAMERFEHAVRFIGLAMSRHARTRHAFHGKSGDLFFSRLVDMIAGLFAGEVSPGARGS